MIIHIVRFTSRLDDERVHELFAACIPEYLAVPGLEQKYYLHFADGQHGGIYVWDSRSSMDAFRAGKLSRSICHVYDVQESTLDVADVVLLLHPDPASPVTTKGNAPRLFDGPTTQVL